MELIISTILGVLIVEIYGWLPHLCDKLLEHAVRQVREKDRDRCREEWSFGLAQLPNTIYRFAHAMSIVVQASRCREDSFQFEQLELGVQLKGVTHTHAEFAEVVTGHKAHLKNSACFSLEQFDEMVASAKSLAVSGAAKGLNFDKFVTLTEQRFETNSKAYQKAIDLSITSLDHCIEKLSEVSVLINRATATLNTLSLQGRNQRLGEREALLLQVESDLHAIGAIFSDASWGTCETFDEANSILIAVRKSLADYGAVLTKMATVFRKKD
jgi:hypothetical protein